MDELSESRQRSQSISAKCMEYEQTVMYGKHKKDLSEAAKQAYKRISSFKKVDRPLIQNNTQVDDQGKIENIISSLIDRFKYSMISEWLFLLLLGFLMAILSFGLDYCITVIHLTQKWLFLNCLDNKLLLITVWVGIPLVLVLFSVKFVSIVSPQAIGSGIPEIKTILRGVDLYEYLSLKVMLAKVIGLVAAIGSRLPIGKEGPFVHISSIVATFLNDHVYKFASFPYEDESKNVHVLSAACAVGVACTFAAPVGGVLFSIEVISMHFALQDYWRGFFCATCGAFMFRFLAVLTRMENTITALINTSFRLEFPFDLKEIAIMMVIGVLSGLIGSLFVMYHKFLVDLIRNKKIIRKLLSLSFVMYPLLFVIPVMLITYPFFIGQYIASDFTMKQALSQLFDNRTWFSLNVTDMNITAPFYNNGFLHPDKSVFFTLSLFCIVHFLMTAGSIILAVPSGCFMPVFLLGAAFGRLIGEFTAFLMPAGFVDETSGIAHAVMPGAYAVVGAASFSGAVTHTISTAVIAFEVTGQLLHILPVMLAVLISNAVARLVSPSIYESIIKIKSLPYLPRLLKSNKYLSSVTVEQFMVEDVKFLSRTNTTYKELKVLLQKDFFCYPIVESKENMVLVGSVTKEDLEDLMNSFESIKVEKSKVDSNNFLQEQKIGRFTTSLADINSDQNQIDNKITEDEEVLKQRRDFSRNYEEIIDFSKCPIDESPFNIVRTTTLHKVHSLFSLLSLHHVFVTKLGRLVGIVALRELRNQLEKAQSSKFLACKQSEENMKNKNQCRNQAHLQVSSSENSLPTTNEIVVTPVITNSQDCVIDISSGCRVNTSFIEFNKVHED